MSDSVHGHGHRPGHDEARLQRARHEVVGADLVTCRDPQAIAGDPAAGVGLVPARLNGRVADLDAEIARGGRLVLAPGDDPQGHRVLREVRVGPLVDVVGDAVAPVLEELDGRPRVVHLVEVHLDRLTEPPDPAGQERRRENEDHPQVEPVEAPAGLPLEAGGSIGADRSLAEPDPEPADEACFAR